MASVLGPEFGLFFTHPTGPPLRFPTLLDALHGRAPVGKGAPAPRTPPCKYCLQDWLLLRSPPSRSSPWLHGPPGLCRAKHSPCRDTSAPSVRRAVLAKPRGVGLPCVRGLLPVPLQLYMWPWGKNVPRPRNTGRASPSTRIWALHVCARVHTRVRVTAHTRTHVCVYTHVWSCSELCSDTQHLPRSQPPTPRTQSHKFPPHHAAHESTGQAACRLLPVLQATPGALSPKDSRLPRPTAPILPSQESRLPRRVWVSKLKAMAHPAAFSLPRSMEKGPFAASNLKMKEWKRAGM